MKFTTLVPKAYNDGSPVPQARLDRLIDALFLPFGGVSIEGETLGIWTDQGIEYRDLSLRVTILCDRDELPAAIRAVVRLGVKLKQKAMWFDVSGYDGVQILSMESGRSGS